MIKIVIAALLHSQLVWHGQAWPDFAQSRFARYGSARKPLMRREEPIEPHVQAIDDTEPTGTVDSIVHDVATLNLAMEGPKVESKVAGSIFPYFKERVNGKGDAVAEEAPSKKVADLEGNLKVQDELARLREQVKTEALLEEKKEEKDKETEDAIQKAIDQEDQKLQEERTKTELAEAKLHNLEAQKGMPVPEYSSPLAEAERGAQAAPAAAEEASRSAAGTEASFLEQKKDKDNIEDDLDMKIKQEGQKLEEEKKLTELAEEKLANLEAAQVDGPGQEGEVGEDAAAGEDAGAGDLPSDALLAVASDDSEIPSKEIPSKEIPSEATKSAAILID